MIIYIYFIKRVDKRHLKLNIAFKRKRKKKKKRKSNTKRKEKEKRKRKFIFQIFLKEIEIVDRAFSLKCCKRI